MNLTTETKCGTNAGHIAHRKKNEPSCDPCRLAFNAYTREWKTKNSTKVLAAKKSYRDSNKESIAAYKKTWAAKNKDRLIAKNRRRRATRLGNGFEPYTLNQVLDIFGSICYLCEQSIDLQAPRQCGTPGWECGLHIDHIIPIARGGMDCLDNVAPTHASCNLSKGDN